HDARARFDGGAAPRGEEAVRELHAPDAEPPVDPGPGPPGAGIPPDLAGAAGDPGPVNPRNPSMRTHHLPSLRHLAFAGVAALALTACGSRGGTSGGAADAAQRVYVAPGTKDEFYAFMSGGFSGQVSVYG